MTEDIKQPQMRWWTADIRTRFISVAYGGVSVDFTLLCVRFKSSMFCINFWTFISCITSPSWSCSQTTNKTRIISPPSSRLYYRISLKILLIITKAPHGRSISISLTISLYLVGVLLKGFFMTLVCLHVSFYVCMQVSFCVKFMYVLCFSFVSFCPRKAVCNLRF